MTSTRAPPLEFLAIVRRGSGLATRMPGSRTARRSLGRASLRSIVSAPACAAMIAGVIAIHSPGLAQQARAQQAGAQRAGAQRAGAQRAAAGMTAEQPDIGRLEIRIQKYDHALGVIARLARPLGAEAECNGVCYFSSGTRPTSWRCAPQEECDLHCDVNPPVGGCR